MPSTSVWRRAHRPQRGGAAVPGRRQHPVRWPQGAGRGELRRARGRDPRAHRAQRRRQDHVLQRDDRRLPAHLRRGPLRRGAARRRKRFAITRLGIARTFQNIRLFGNMTALENVLVGADAHHRTNVIDALFRLAAAPPRGARGRGDGPRGHEVPRAGAAGRRAGPQPPLRRAAPAGDRPGHGHQAAAALPGRAGRGLQPGGEGPADGPDPADPRPAGSPCCSSSTTCAWSWASATGSPSWSSAARSPKGRPPRSATTRRSSPPTSAPRPTRSRTTEGALMLLEVDGLCVNYGRIEAIRDITFDVEQGVDGHPHRGQRRGQDDDAEDPLGAAQGPGRRPCGSRARTSPTWPSHERVPLGISQAPEGRRHLPGHDRRREPGHGRLLARGPGEDAAQGTWSGCSRCSRGCTSGATRLAGTMSGGEQQMLAIGRALMARPTLLLLDEPSMGLAPKLIQQIFSIIIEINEQGTTVLLVEQNAAQALQDRRHGLHPGDRRGGPHRHRLGAGRR